MLVYLAKNPHGSLLLGRYRIYGRLTGMPPTEIPYQLHKAARETFCDATYRSDYLSKLFGVPISPIAFRYSEIFHLPHVTLLTLARDLKMTDHGCFMRRHAMIYRLKKAIQGIM